MDPFKHSAKAFNHVSKSTTDETDGMKGQATTTHGVFVSLSLLLSGESLRYKLNIIVELSVTFNKSMKLMS